MKCRHGYEWCNRSDSICRPCIADLQAENAKLRGLLRGVQDSGASHGRTLLKPGLSKAIDAALKGEPE